MHSRLPSASLIQSNARHHHHHHHVPWHEQTKYHGSSTSANAPSPAVFTFAPLPQLGTQSPLDVSTVALCTMELTSSFMWVPSLSLNDHPPMASYGGDPPHLHSLATLQTSVPNLQRGSSSMSASWRTNACKHPLLYGFTQLALCAKFLQAVFTQDGDQDKNHISSKGLPLLEVQKQRLLFCSIGLAGREVRDVEKLNISQAESSLVSDNSSNEKGSNSVDIQSLSSGEATRNLNESDTEKGKKVAAGNRAYNTVKHLSAGAISAMVSRTFVAPLERLKLEYMVRGAQQNVLQIIRLIVASEGFGGFWKGNVVNLLRTAPFKSVNFFCYDVYRKRLLEITGREEATNFERLVAGGAAGISATLLCFPMDTIRTKMVAPGGEALGGVIGCFQHMLRTEGFFSLYKGLLPAVISMAPSGAVFYGVYDILKTSYLQSPEGQEDLRKRIEMEKRRRRSERKVQGDVLEEGFETKVQANLKEEAGKLGQLELGPVRTLVYGAIAGICAEMATYPFEVVRRQLQMQNAATKMGALATCRGLMQRGGVGAFYSGLLPSALQVLPSASISYFVYECMKIFLEVS